MADTPHLMSFTRCSTDNTCRYKRFLSREWGGTGLIPILGGWDAAFGTLAHTGLERFAKQEHPFMRSEVLQLADQYRMPSRLAQSWASLAEGFIWGFQRTIWPYWMAEYDVFDTEKWIEWEPAPGFLFRARQDLLLKSKIDGHIAMVDYKTTSSTKPQWIASWAKSVQLHTSMYALKQSTGIEVRNALVVGLNKGYLDEKIGVRRSPLTVGYADRMGIFPNYSYDYRKGRGWEVFLPWEEEGMGTERWVSEMPQDLLSSQFPLTGPISPRDDIAETWFRQQLAREREVQHAVQILNSATDDATLDSTIDQYFRSNFDACDPAFGYSCEYKPLCWVPHVKEDPLGSGQFVRYEEQG